MTGVAFCKYHKSVRDGHGQLLIDGKLAFSLPVAAQWGYKRIDRLKFHQVFGGVSMTYDAASKHILLSPACRKYAEEQLKDYIEYERKYKLAKSKAAKKK